jgi:hypothetical protein
MTTPNIVGRDTDGTPWVTVRYVIDVQVIAETESEAIYFADLALRDNLDGAEGTPLEVVQ